MNDDYNIAPIHGRPADQSMGHILCREDFWQKGDPMFASTDDLRRGYADRNAGAPAILPLVDEAGQD